MWVYSVHYNLLVLRRSGCWETVALLGIRSQEVIVYLFSHCYFSLNGSLQNTCSCLGAGMLEGLLRVCIVNTSSITLWLAAGNGCGVAGILFVTRLRALPLTAFCSCCRTGLAVAQTNPVADASSVLTQWFSKVRFKEQIHHRVIKGGRFGENSCQRKCCGWDLLIGTEGRPHGHHCVGTPGRQEANAYSHWELEGKHRGLICHILSRNAARCTHSCLTHILTHFFFL